MDNSWEKAFNTGITCARVCVRERDKETKYDVV